MVSGNVKIKDTIETITSEIRESVMALEMVYGGCENETTSAIISCIVRSTKSSLRKADNLINSLLTIEKAPSLKPEIETITPQNSFAARLRLALAHSGITQAELAWSIRVSQSTISSYVTGKVQPHIGVISKLSEALGVHIDWLLNGTGDMVYLTHSNEA